MKPCKHFPIIGIDADYRYGGCWKITSATMSQITRKCMKCGEVITSSLTSYNSELFMSDKRRHALAKDRDENHVNMIQPIDSKTGKFNEEFGKHYGYNPMKTPAPQLMRKDETIDETGTKIAEENIKLQPFKQK